MNFPELKEAEGTLAARRKTMHDVLAEAGAELNFEAVKTFSGSTVEKVAEFQKLDAEINDLEQKAVELRKVADIAGRHRAAGNDDRTERGDDSDRQPASKSFASQFLKSAARKAQNTQVELDVDLKTLMSRTAGIAPESTRSGLFVDAATRPVQVTDLLPMIPTGQAAYKYMEETTFTNNAAERAEGGTYGEAALATTERSVTIETIGVWLPVTDEQLEDEAGAEAYINQRLPFMLSQRLDGQILTGDGSTPNILGINNKGSIQTQAKAADSVPDAVYKAITKVRVTGRAMPNAIVMHPNDWQAIRLLQTTDGIYIWGSPSDAGVARIWGLPVVESDAQTENTAVVGDFANFSLLVMRRGILVEKTNAHDTYFINGKQAIRAGVRCATVWTRAAAFATVTGI
jgi:HK97 family phage major capsid protein